MDGFGLWYKHVRSKVYSPYFRKMVGMGGGDKGRVVAVCLFVFFVGFSSNDVCFALFVVCFCKLLQPSSSFVLGVCFVWLVTCCVGSSSSWTNDFFGFRCIVSYWWLSDDNLLTSVCPSIENVLHHDKGVGVLVVDRVEYYCRMYSTVRYTYNRKDRMS